MTSRGSGDPLFAPTVDTTPLSQDEREGLRPSHIVLRSELNEWEQENILAAEHFAFARRRNPVNEAFGRSLHRRMFANVWRWAGTYRTTDKNIGVDRRHIAQRLYGHYDDIVYQIAHEVYGPDEIAARFHHGLVFIHPFPNGNGRWSRLMADILLLRLEQRRFTSGSASGLSPDQARAAYIAALRAADRHDFAPLVAFLRS